MEIKVNGNRIFQLREKRSISKVELAKQLKVHVRTIDNFESGKSDPKTKDLLRMSKLFDVTIDYILNNEYKTQKNMKLYDEVWGNFLWNNCTRRDLNELAEAINYDNGMLKVLYFILKAKSENERAETLKKTFNLNIQ